MVFQIPDNLNPALMGLAWLIGRWQGNGHGQWPGVGEFSFGQQIDFATNEGPYLHYLSQIYTTDAEGNPQKPLTMETGFWRPTEGGGLECVLTSPEGWAEIWVGESSGAKIELRTDLVARTDSAELAYTAGHRLYGSVEGDLMWTFDRATADIELRSYMWGRLQRI